jgi:hypothetical protein
MILERLHDWYWANRYWPKRRAVLGSDPEWAALDASESGLLTVDADEELESWVASVFRRSEIERRLWPVEPWPERLWVRWEQRPHLAGLYEARARRRSDVGGGADEGMGGEHAWAMGSRLAGAVAGTVALARRVAHDREYDGMTWSESVDILADNDEPPATCLDYARGQVSDGCHPDCALPHRGRVTRLKSRPGALARINGERDSAQPDSGTP